MKKQNWLQRLFPPNESQAIIAYAPPSPEVMEKVLLTGDLASLTPPQRLSYYESVCRALKLNPLTKPFEYITLNGKLTLYTRKDCTDQLRKIYNVSIKILSREIADGAIVVYSRASLPGGREDESLGSVSCVYPAQVKTSSGWRDHPKAGLPLTGEDRANAMMKAETKAKRRVTLSICGLGMFDESETESMPVEPMTAKDKVEAATTNRLAIENDEIDLSPVGPITAENCGDVVCHIGKAQGDMLGKKVNELHPKILQWLQNHYDEGDGIRWGNPPDEKDERLKTAVDLALKKLNEA